MIFDLSGAPHGESVIRLGTLTLGDTPRVAVGFSDDAIPDLLASGRAAGLDIAEIRIDQFTSHERVHILRVLDTFSEIPTIGTIRSQSEGGLWRGTEQERFSLFETVIPHLDAVDVELSADIRHAVIQKAHDAGKLCIVSYHNFATTEPLQDLAKRIDQAKTEGADIVKIATQVERREHLQILAEITLRYARKNIIVVGMGAHGLASRLFFPSLGSLITFAYVGKPTAPGQLPYPEVFGLLREMDQSYNQEKINSMQLMEFC